MALTVLELRELLAEILEGATGKPRDHWRDAIGSIEKLPLWRHPRSNWAVSPSAHGNDLVAIEKAIEIVRSEHPYVA